MSDGPPPPHPRPHALPPPLGKALGIDHGARRIGVATCDGLGITVTPLEVVDGRDRPAAVARIAAIADDREATVLVFGLPIHMDGRAHNGAKKVRAFATLCASATGLPTVFIDERLTTVEAERHLLSTGHGVRDLKGKVDKIAAAIILRDWIDSRSRA